jgi:hypothetical protein
MRPAVFLCSVLLVAAVCRADDDEECDCEKRFGGLRGDILRNRADRNDVEINRLFTAAYRLEEALDKLDHNGPKVQELKARVDALTGTQNSYIAFSFLFKLHTDVGNFYSRIFILILLDHMEKFDGS